MRFKVVNAINSTFLSIKLCSISFAINCLLSKILYKLGVQIMLSCVCNILIRLLGTLTLCQFRFLSSAAVAFCLSLGFDSIPGPVSN